MQTYDLIIIGAGPGGMSAAVYAGRYKLKTLVIGELLGGMAAEAVKICNYLGFKSISGKEFTERMEEQAKGSGVKLRYERVSEIARKEEEKGQEGHFEVRTNTAGYKAKKIILALGSEKRKLNLAGLDSFLGKGVSYCAVCDAVFFQDKIVGVVGGGNTALTAALLLAEYAKKVYIFYRQDNFFRAEPAWVESVEKNRKIEPMFKAEVAELWGKKKLEGVKLKNGDEVKLEGLFIEVGSIPNVVLAEQLGIELEGRFVKVDREQRTNVPGVFAAGDITNNPLKQIVTAAAEGAVAATSAYKEIKEGKALLKPTRSAAQVSRTTRVFTGGS